LTLQNHYQIKLFLLKTKMQNIDQSEQAEIAQILEKILANDNEVRKAAEAQLAQAKLASPDKYCILMCSIFHPAQEGIKLEAKQLAAVILRRNISIEAIDTQDIQNLSNNDNLWQRLSDDTRL